MRPPEGMIGKAWDWLRDDFVGDFDRVRSIWSGLNNRENKPYQYLWYLFDSEDDFQKVANEKTPPSIVRRKDRSKILEEGFESGHSATDAAHLKVPVYQGLPGVVGLGVELVSEKKGVWKKIQAINVGANEQFEVGIFKVGGGTIKNFTSDRLITEQASRNDTIKVDSRGILDGGQRKKFTEIKYVHESGDQIVQGTQDCSFTLTENTVIRVEAKYSPGGRTMTKIVRVNIAQTPPPQNQTFRVELLDGSNNTITDIRRGETIAKIKATVESGFEFVTTGQNKIFIVKNNHDLHEESLSSRGVSFNEGDTTIEIDNFQIPNDPQITDNCRIELDLDTRPRSP